MNALRTSICAAVTIAAVAMIAAVTARAPSPQGGGSSHTVTKADFERWKTELSNWGR